jgi:general stress protein 26
MPMQHPVTELDPRFSEPNAVATSWDETRRTLESAELFWISTVRADGRPHVTPLVAIWFEGAIHFATGGGEQKAVNLRTNQNAILTTGRNDWESGVDIVIEGEAERVTDENILEQLAKAWAAKWDGRWQYEAHQNGFRHEGGDDPVLVFAVRPTKVFAFAKGTFGQTCHRFSFPPRC